MPDDKDKAYCDYTIVEDGILLSYNAAQTFDYVLAIHYEFSWMKSTGRMSKLSNQDMSDYVYALDKYKGGETNVFVEGYDLVSLALFDADKNLIYASGEYGNGGNYAFVDEKGKTIHIGYIDKSIKLSNYPNAKYAIFSTGVHSTYERVLNSDGVNVGWSSKKAKIAII